MARKYLSVETIGDGSFYGALFDSVGYEELADKVLAIPKLRRLFKEHLADAGIYEITEDAIVAGFANWFFDYLDGLDVKVSINIEDLAG